MSRLHLPLVDSLIDPTDEASLQRIAQEIDARFPHRRRRRTLPLLLAAATVLAATTAVVLLARRDGGPLRLADGRAVVAVEAAWVESALALSDGSRIRLFPGSRLEPLETSGSTFSAVLARGSADFDVRPGGPRHWVIECGLATVEVVGTEFACERSPGRLRVIVRRGAVLVRGERVPDRARRLAAGDMLVVLEDPARTRPTAAKVPAEAEVAAGAVRPPATAVVAAMPPERATPPNRGGALPSWRDLARRGHNSEAFTALGTDGLERESRQLGVKDLLTLADVARLSGHPADAVAPLERILAEFSTDSQAPLAAFTLGRLELDSLGRADRAASAFGQALILGIPHSLREDVRARLVEAYARSGNHAAARDAADAYLQEFPHGRHLRAIESWLRAR